MAFIDKLLGKYDMKQFYLTGIIAFFLIVGGNIFSIIHYWELTYIAAKISSIASTAFYAALFLLFLKNYRSLKINEDLFKKGSEEQGKTQEQGDYSEEELDNLFDEMDK